MRPGLILLAHGARDTRWREPFVRLVERIGVKQPQSLLRLAFLELMTPDLLTAGQELAVAGCDAVVVVPVFLGQGGHVREDVPKLVEALQQRCPAIRVSLGRTAGEDEAVLDALASFCIAELARAANP